MSNVSQFGPIDIHPKTTKKPKYTIINHLKQSNDVSHQVNPMLNYNQIQTIAGSAVTSQQHKTPSKQNQYRIIVITV